MMQTICTLQQEYCNATTDGEKKFIKNKMNNYMRILDNQINMAYTDLTNAQTNINKAQKFKNEIENIQQKDKVVDKISKINNLSQVYAKAPDITCASSSMERITFVGCGGWDKS